mgnify:FL=1
MKLKTAFIVMFVFLIAFMMCTKVEQQQPADRTLRSGVPFDHQILEDTDARHPFVVDVNKDGQNDVIIITNYGGANSYDSKLQEEA